jgi:hypothetical protein
VAAAGDLEQPAKGWRAVLRVHAAAELFPPMPPGELRALGEDIKAHGLQNRVKVLVKHNGNGTLEYFVLDGRNRLDAREAVGLHVEVIEGGALNYELVEEVEGDIDPFAYVVSANIHRRHLTTEQKHDVIAALLKAKPDWSNRRVAESVRVSHNTVGDVRAELESTGQIAQLDKTVGKDKRARKSKPKPRFLAPKRKCTPLDAVVEMIASAERLDKSRHGTSDETRVMRLVLEAADRPQLRAIVDAGSRLSDEWKRAAAERWESAALDVRNVEGASITAAPAAAPRPPSKSTDEITAIALRVRRNTTNADVVALCDWVLAAARYEANALGAH